MALSAPNVDFAGTYTIGIYPQGSTVEDWDYFLTLTVTGMEGANPISGATADTAVQALVDDLTAAGWVFSGGTKFLAGTQNLTPGEAP